MVVTVMIPSIGQIELFNHSLMIIIIVIIISYLKPFSSVQIVSIR